MNRDLHVLAKDGNIAAKAFASWLLCLQEELVCSLRAE